MVPVTTYHDPISRMDIAPDKGWSYCPGRDDLEPMTLKPSTALYKSVGGLVYKKPAITDLPARLLTPDLMLPKHQDTGMSQEDYINTFLSAFGAKIGQEAIYKDIVGDPLVISDALFKNRQFPRDTYKVFKADREQYLPLLADTIKHPTEIWLTWVEGKDGKQRLCKRYIGIYKDTTGKIGGYAVFDNIDGTWQGTTTFQADLDYLDKQRTGTLLYPKSIKK